jgi:hypothetical protein
MHDRGSAGGELNQPQRRENGSLIQGLSQEYQALTGEMLTRTSGRFQFLGLMTTAAALFASGIGGAANKFPVWASVTLSLAVLLLGLGFFFTLGRHIVRLSSRVAEIESRINGLLPAPADGKPVLSWESERQQRPLLDRINYGQFRRRP